MTMDDLMSLVKAGFSKEEILTLTGSTPPPTEPTPEVKADEPTVEPEVENKPVDNTEQKTEEPTPQTTNVNFAPMMTDAQIEKLAQMLNRGTATIDVPQPRDTEAILNEHFKNLMLGKE